MTHPDDDRNAEPVTPSPAMSEGMARDSESDAAAATEMPGADTPPPMPPSVTGGPGQSMPLAAPDVSRVTEYPATGTTPTDEPTSAEPTLEASTADEWRTADPSASAQAPATDTSQPAPGMSQPAMGEGVSGDLRSADSVAGEQLSTSSSQMADTPAAPSPSSPDMTSSTARDDDDDLTETTTTAVTWQAPARPAEPPSAVTPSMAPSQPSSYEHPPESTSGAAGAAGAAGQSWQQPGYQQPGSQQLGQQQPSQQWPAQPPQSSQQWQPSTPGQSASAPSGASAAPGSQQWQPSSPQPGQWQQPTQPGQPAPVQAPPAQQWQQPAQPYPGQPPAAYSAPAGGYSPPVAGYPSQPGYAPPGAYPAQPQGYPGQAYAPVGAAYSTSALVAVAGMVLLIFGLIDAIGGGFLFTNRGALRDLVAPIREINIGIRLDRAGVESLFGAVPATLLIVGVLEVIAGAGIFLHKGWGRWLGVLLSLFGLLVSIVGLSFALALAPGLSVQVLAAVVFLLGYAFILLALLAGGRHFRSSAVAPAYPPQGYPPQAYPPR